MPVSWTWRGWDAGLPWPSAHCTNMLPPTFSLRLPKYRGVGLQAPRASPCLQPSHQSLPRAISASGGHSCWGQVCSCQPSSILLIKPNELHLTTTWPCHVAPPPPRGCPSVGLGRPLCAPLERPPPLNQERAEVPRARPSTQASKSLRSACTSPWPPSRLSTTLPDGG